MLRCVSALVIALLITGLWPASSFPGVKQAAPSFSETYRSYRKLSGRTEAKREDWLRVVESFASIHRSEKGSQTGKRSLFLAGRSCLALYRESGRVEDLDRAIKFLNEFVQKHRKGRDLIEGLQELKEAHLMKRGLKGPPAAQPSTVSSGPSQKVPAAVSSVPVAQPPAPLQSSSPVAISASAGASPSPACTGPPVPEGACHTAHTDDSPDRASGDTGVQRNPYCGPRDSTPSGPPKPLQTASIAPPSVSDAVPATRRKLGPFQSFVVVIDPGHGGRDPGAVSEDGQLKEKEVTLDVALRISERLKSQAPGITVHLTRSDDRTMGLKERTAFANALNADLFLSIHCNAAEDASSKGVETYYLSKAGSSKAMAVAARENGIPLAKMNDLEATLLDLMLTSKKTESVRLATVVHCALIKALSGIAAPKRDRGVRRGPFYVLFGAKMPAILVECGFINNRRDKEKLSNPEHLDAIADGLASGTRMYIEGLGKKG